MENNTAIALRRSNEIAMSEIHSGSMIENMLETFEVIHSALDSADIESKNNTSIGIVDRLKGLLAKSKEEQEKLIATDELHNKALEKIEKQRVKIEGLTYELGITVNSNNVLSKASQRRIDELERIKLERDELRDRLNEKQAVPMLAQSKQLDLGLKGGTGTVTIDPYTQYFGSVTVAPTRATNNIGAF